MKNLTIIVLTVLLVAALLSGFLLYGKYVDLKDTLKTGGEEVASLNAKIHALEGELKKEKDSEEAMKRELLHKDARVAEFQEKLGGERATAQSKIEELESAYTSLVSGLKGQLKSKEMTLKAFEEKLSITFVDRILFDLGKATITPEGARVLEKVGHILKSAKGMQIRVVGHTDNISIRKEYRYKFPSNWELSAARAASVVRFFQRECRLGPKNLEAVGKSFYEPVASNEVEEGRVQNRRVEIVIAPKMEQ